MTVCVFRGREMLRWTFAIRVRVLCLFFFWTILLPVLCNCGFSFTFYIYSLSLLQQSTRWQDKINNNKSFQQVLDIWYKLFARLQHETKFITFFFFLDFHIVTYFDTQKDARNQNGLDGYWLLPQCYLFWKNMLSGIYWILKSFFLWLEVRWKGVKNHSKKDNRSYYISI